MATRWTSHSAPSRAATRPGTGLAGAVRRRRTGHGAARYLVVVLALVTAGIAVTGVVTAARILSDGAHTRAGQQFDDGRVPTSFGAFWVDSFEEIAVPRIVHQGHIGIPQGGQPEKVALEVKITFANTTAAPVELTPARFSLRLAPDAAPIPVEGASFESVRLIPGAMFDARMQFPVKGGEHQLSLLFDDPEGRAPIAVDLGTARLQDTDDNHS